MADRSVNPGVVRASEEPAAAKRPVARRPGRTKRGRPPKFGRPSEVVALTLPADAIEQLRSIHPDLGWAIVQLVERTLSGTGHEQEREAKVRLAELVHLPGRRALIVVQPAAFAGLRGVFTIPLAGGRAFLAFDGSGGIADLGIAILDRIDELPPRSEQRKQLREVRDSVRQWRRQSGLVFRTPHIIVAEGRAETDACQQPTLGAVGGDKPAARR